MPLPTGLVGQRAGEEGLANAGRAANQHVLVRLDPVTGHQAGEQRPVEAAGVTEVDVFRGGGLLELGPFEASGVLARFALGSFAVEQQAKRDAEEAARRKAAEEKEEELARIRAEKRAAEQERLAAEKAEAEAAAAAEAPVVVATAPAPKKAGKGKQVALAVGGVAVAAAVARRLAACWPM